MKIFRFLVEQNGRKRIFRTMSKHLNGAVRKLYQMYEFDEIVEIL